MIEDENEHVRRATIEALERKLRIYLGLAVFSFFLLAVFVRLSPARFISQPWTHLLFRLLERLTIVTFAVSALVLAPTAWYYRTLLLSPERSATNLPNRYRFVAWSVVTIIVLLFVGFMWYSVDHGLTKLW